MKATTRNICVDLDGTLILSDLLFEVCLKFIKRNPLNFFLLFLWLLKGKANLKYQLARKVEPDFHVMPYNITLLNWLQQQKQDGAALWLVTASNEVYANQVAKHLGIFDGVIGSTSTVNFYGSTKAKGLVDRFGDKGFIYCGNSTEDLQVWRFAEKAVLVNCSRSLSRRAHKISSVLEEFPPAKCRISTFLKAFRVHQWSKNILIFAPLVAAHAYHDSHLLALSLAAFIAFCLCASSVYILNDLLDLESDRAHPRKSLRPFASGLVSIPVGVFSSITLLVLSFLIAAYTSVNFLLVLVVYYLLTLSYSVSLKRLVITDIVVLASLYTIRIVAGGVVGEIDLSFWFLLFSLFLFFSLALVKRYAELETMRRLGKLGAQGRGYHVDDLPVLCAMGVATGFLSVLILALYINSPTVGALYTKAEGLWVLCLSMLYWMSYVWLRAHRGEMHDDPVVFALRDKTSILIGSISIVAVYLAM